MFWRRAAPVRIPCNHDSTKEFKSAYKALSGRFGFGVGHIYSMIEH